MYCYPGASPFTVRTLRPSLNRSVGGDLSRLVTPCHHQDGDRIETLHVYVCTQRRNIRITSSLPRLGRLCPSEAKPLYPRSSVPPHAYALLWNVYWIIVLSRTLPDCPTCTWLLWVSLQSCEQTSVSCEMISRSGGLVCEGSCPVSRVPCHLLILPPLVERLTSLPKYHGHYADSLTQDDLVLPGAKAAKMAACRPRAFRASSRDLSGILTLSQCHKLHNGMSHGHVCSHQAGIKPHVQCTSIAQGATPLVGLSSTLTGRTVVWGGQGF
jgi:hypothetical protein